AKQFNDSLTPANLDEFLELARKQGFLKRAHDRARDEAAPSGRRRKRLTPQSLVYWRRSLCDPDRLLTWLTPKIPWVWTRAFFYISLALILTSLVVLWTGRQGFFDPLASFMRWDSLALVWLIILLVTGI